MCVSGSQDYGAKWLTILGASNVLRSPRVHNYLPPRPQLYGRCLGRVGKPRPVTDHHAARI